LFVLELLLLLLPLFVLELLLFRCQRFGLRTLLLLPRRLSFRRRRLEFARRGSLQFRSRRGNDWLRLGIRLNRSRHLRRLIRIRPVARPVRRLRFGGLTWPSGVRHIPWLVVRSIRIGRFLHRRCRRLRALAWQRCLRPRSRLGNDWLTGIRLNRSRRLRRLIRNRPVARPIHRRRIGGLAWSSRARRIPRLVARLANVWSGRLCRRRQFDRRLHGGSIRWTQGLHFVPLQGLSRMLG